VRAGRRPALSPAGDIDGVVLADKPPGRTSHDITTMVRRGLGVRKAGHAGTLDPFATGLLLVLVGRARRVQRFFTALPKEYEAVARFGAVSTTGDPDGAITQTGVLPSGPLALPHGRIRQRPPAYSAVRIGGRRAYELARGGIEVEVPEREVEIHACEELWRTPERAGLRIVCSSGTYVRSLVADLGDAYTEELRRTRIGPFRVEDADPMRVIPLADALGFFASVRLEGDDARRAAHGVAVSPGGPPEPPRAGWEVPDPPREVLLLDEAGPVALAEPREDGLLKPVVGFRA
jgi:tRNA pseudouridine55 synthase